MEDAQAAAMDVSDSLFEEMAPIAAVGPSEVPLEEASQRPQHEEQPSTSATPMVVEAPTSATAAPKAEGAGADDDEEEEYDGDDVDVEEGDLGHTPVDAGTVKLIEDQDAVEAFVEARQEQKKLIQEAREKIVQEGGLDPQGPQGGSRKLEYLMAQSEMFAHFLGAQNIDKKKKRSAAGSRARSMEEKEEDAMLMKTAQSNQRVTRLMTQPTLITGGTMRPYQLEGLNWMIKLHDNGINGILADEMGLGKTLQTISLLAYLKESRNINGPHIVIVPKSTVGNWCKEFNRWCPSIQVVKLLGSKEERAAVVQEYLSLRGERKFFNVVVTSYEGVLKEKNFLEKIEWRYVIIDEAHRIKNEKSSLSRMVRLFKSQFRMLITGTPLQNDLHELWSLLNYIMPDVFEDSDTFDEWFNLSDSQGSDNVIKKLHQVLKPFMLRRIKSDVEKDLPPKKEIKLFIGMTQMQKDVYKKILRRDGAALNALGGPDRVRLLNILMQLRKCCNHPYLFEGTEPGPPFIEGPHLWENCGKMTLLDKLLPRLQEQGSRVLIFCQMTRQLDILEDYLRMKYYQYCRIDGSTKGEDRDNAVDIFNAPGSPKFAFLLSTRAGGLGINLATADTVILYDSDWNPQVDLQAMDRAHRIGQTKQVRVFRFVTEGTVEEKIVERADKKLFLDAAVIQQGALADKNSSLSKDELLHMVKFGADEIMQATGTTFTDEDIDIILQRGEARTEEQAAKFQKDVQHNLAKFTLVDEEERNLFDFEGEDWRNKRNDGLVFDMGTRERKTNINYDIDALLRGAPREKKEGAPQQPAVKRGRKLVMPEHQFFDREKIQVIHDKETGLLTQKQEQNNLIKELRAGRKAATEKFPGRDPNQVADELEAEIASGKFDLSPEEQAERERLMKEGYRDWSRKDMRILVAAIERNGRKEKAKILQEVAAETNKDEKDVAKYYKAFLERYTELPNAQSIMDRIRKGEARIQRNSEIKEALDAKVARHRNPWQSLTLNYGNQGKAQRSFTDEEDVFLVVLMHRLGYGNWERIRMEIRKAPKFSFNWFFKSRTASELQKRGDALIKLIEKENADLDPRGTVTKMTTKRKADDEDSANGSDDGKGRKSADFVKSKKQK